MLIFVLACSAGSPPDSALAAPRPTPEPDLTEASRDREPPAPTTDPITSVRQLDGRDGQEVVLHGTYVLLDLRQRKRPPAQYRGHAAVQLEGGRVLLEPNYAPEAIRPQSEQALNGTEVVVVGTYHSQPPPSPDNAATLQMAVLSPVASVSPQK